MRTRTFKKQDYTGFIKTMDEKYDISGNSPNLSKKSEGDKEDIDAIVENVNKNFERDYFNKFSFSDVDENSYIDPNCFITLTKYREPIKVSFDNANINNINNNVKGSVDQRLSNYKSLLDKIMKETIIGVCNIDGSKSPVKSFDSQLSGETILYKQPRLCGRSSKKQAQPYVPPAKRVVKIKVNIEVDINNIGDLIKLIETYPVDETKEYNINMDGLHKIHNSLIDLNNMIGMKELKENVVDQILYYIQDINKSGDFMHTVIYGPPGTGKTEIAKIIGQIFSKLGVLKKGVFRKVTRSDLVAGYLGQTAIKTRDVINECLGGVLFIDEAYALGNNEKRDSFSKECIDTLCEALSNHKEDLMVIIAGYETELKECFFNYNQGLDSRFTWRFKTDEYKGEELYNIFLKKVKEIKWEIDTSVEGTDQKITKDWFEKSLEYFKFFGRDVETLLAKTKIVHSRRVFCKPQNEKMKLNLKDLERGFDLYLKNDEVKKRKEVESLKNIIKTMYV